MTRTFRRAGLGLVALSVLSLALLSARAVRSDDAAKPSPVEGAWKQVEQKNGTAEEYRRIPEDLQMIDLVTGGRFVWTIIKEGRVVSAAGGKYTVNKDKFTEIIEYIHGEGVPASFVGSSFEFNWTVEGNIWHKFGTIKVNDQDYKIDEKWERCR